MKEISIRKRNGKIFVFSVSDEDYDFLMQWRWHISGGYAARRTKKAEGQGQRKVYMHRIILERKLEGPIPDGFSGDHIDRDVTNNTRENLTGRHQAGELF